MNNESLPRIDLELLELLRRVADAGSITSAARQTGGSQSALSRRIQEAEARLGFTVFDRTTRSLVLTAAGQILLRETEAMPHILEGALRKVREDCFGELPVIRVGVSRSLSLAHLPGLFHSNKTEEQTRIELSHPRGKAVIGGVLSAKLDVGIVPLPPQIPQDLEVSHQFEDEFVLISLQESNANLRRKPSLRTWSVKQRWLLPPAQSTSRLVLQNWFLTKGVEVSPAMELDSFDVMVQLVELGMGVAFVPRRALSAFRRSSKLQRLDVGGSPTRKLAVLTRKEPEPPRAVREFVAGILFS
ncbi:LysR family transcriptional regulator [Roseibacillus persicicus]|uniref:LysR family transcriptional regulator n=1 Tax=Roseibacillus persicicus TaxID=454148 RepID=A0A918THA7_9BACT|nr:LysR family transcriptional regulator [Roseibacillus persicicus]GHC48414.1 LysR family transcriptional regulator [Roseibacillus persicicus]